MEILVSVAAQKLSKLSKGEQTRQSILEAAEKSFSELGYDATKLEDVGDVVGVKRAAIFYYFSGKKELFDAVFTDIHDTLMHYSMQRLAGARDPWERLMLLVESWVDYMVARPTAARLLLRNCANAAHPDDYSADFSRDTLQLMRDILKAGVSSGRFASGNSVHLINLLSGSILHYVCNPEQLSGGRAYRPDAPSEIVAFKAVLRKTARAVLELRDRR